MFSSPVLRTVGLVWKPIKANSTTKRNTRVQSKRVADVEAFLRPHRLGSWNRTSYDNAHNLSTAKAVTLENYEAEKQNAALLIARREKRAAKALERKQLIEKQKREATEARNNEAKQIVERLRKEGQIKAYPTF